MGVLTFFGYAKQPAIMGVTTQPIFSLNTFVVLYNPEIKNNLK
jgi:hypothetical protein